MRAWEALARGDAAAVGVYPKMCLILGESLRSPRRDAEARVAFERIIAEFGFAQCWDTRGWFWKVAEGARARLTVLP